LTAEETERVIAAVDLLKPMGLRDRAILETLYSTGIRRCELAGVRIFDVDSERKTLIVRQGKGKKDRIIPIGERALHWVGRYLEELRPKLVSIPDEGVLFLSEAGETMLLARLTDLVRRCVKRAELGKTGSCHLFRHTMATLMLENGADIRFIQEMLGHESLETTQIYTQVSIRKLKEIHTATHPARLEAEPRTSPELSTEAAAEDQGDA
jgi:integrase/recombinase XerD